MGINEALRLNINYKIIKFFHENQSSIDTPRGVAAWINEDRCNVKRSLEELTSLKILVAHRSTSTTGYSYTRDAKFIKKIDQLLKKRSA